MTAILVKTNIIDILPDKFRRRRTTAFSKDIEDFLQETLNTKVTVRSATSVGGYNIEFMDSKKDTWFRLIYGYYVL